MDLYKDQYLSFIKIGCLNCNRLVDRLPFFHEDLFYYFVGTYRSFKNNFKIINRWDKGNIEKRQEVFEAQNEKSIFYYYNYYDDQFEGIFDPCRYKDLNIEFDFNHTNAKLIFYEPKEKLIKFEFSLRDYIGGPDVTKETNDHIKRYDKMPDGPDEVIGFKMNFNFSLICRECYKTNIKTIREKISCAQNRTFELNTMPYPEYLKTDHWEWVSSEVKSRDGHMCRLCNSKDRLEVHHRCYDHRGTEQHFLEDLITLCHNCHSKFHDIKE